MVDRPPHPLRWDIFCRVIDNYGDAGVCWRLAADLAARSETVCLYIDAPDVLHGLIGKSDKATTVHIRTWPEPDQTFEPQAVADVVIEAFACDPPDAYIDAMSRATKNVAWINLEYLSAEDWVASSHRLPSPHPRYALTKYFYFPGFTDATGGLIREPGLIGHLPTPPRNSFTGDQALRLFLFSYAQPQIANWLDALAHADMPTYLGVTGCPATKSITEWQQRHGESENLTIEYLDFVAQSEFDSLLAGFDILFVRGEDSFVRAQWAAKPLIWHIYPQAEDAHLVKLNAFYDRYLGLGILSQAEQDLYREVVACWNNAQSDRGTELLAHLWPDFVKMYPQLLENALAWRNQLLKQQDLVTQLRDFVGHLVKY